MKPQSCNFRKVHLNSDDFFLNSRFYGLLLKNIRVMLNSSCNWAGKRNSSLAEKTKTTMGAQMFNEQSVKIQTVIVTL